MSEFIGELGDVGDDGRLRCLHGKVDTTISCMCTCIAASTQCSRCVVYGSGTMACYYSPSARMHSKGYGTWSMCLCLSVFMRSGTTGIKQTYMSNTNCFSRTHAQKIMWRFLPQMAMFDFEKLAVMLSKPPGPTRHTFLCL